MNLAAAPAHNPTPPISRRLAPPVTRPGRLEDEEVRPYVIVSDLGKGSFATVYRGYHEVSLRIYSCGLMSLIVFVLSKPVRKLLSRQLREVD